MPENRVSASLFFGFAEDSGPSLGEWQCVFELAAFSGGLFSGCPAHYPSIFDFQNVVLPWAQW